MPSNPEEKEHNPVIELFKAIKKAEEKKKKIQEKSPDWYII